MEKQTMNAIKSIYKFNKECKHPDGSCLLDQGYDDLKESAFSIEEMLEGFNLDVLGTLLLEDDKSPKAISRKIMWHTNGINMTDVDRLDKHLDSIVYNFGSIFKLGLTPQQAIRALSVVCDANLQKTKNTIIDEQGKVCKNKDFVPPEQALQAILDERQ